MGYRTLNEWLSWQEGLHPRAIDLGLERPRQVFQAMGLGDALSVSNCHVITVAGTNGKGSSVTMLEAILLVSGYRVGCYTSPHLLRYNERIRVNGRPVLDQPICEAFERIDNARQGVSLTYFEFSTLAALDIFIHSALDVVILEVGMGGRLDAVNLVDADLTLITTIDLDHTDWLGEDREQIAVEKAGVMRGGRVTVCSDPRPPQALQQVASQIGATLLLLGRDYRWNYHDTAYSASVATTWDLQWDGEGMTALPPPALTGQMQFNNAAGVIMALQQLRREIPLIAGAVEQGLRGAQLSGRWQCFLNHQGGADLILDVAHNRDSARALADNLRHYPSKGERFAVVAMLADKDHVAVIEELTGLFDHWYVAGLELPRGGQGTALAASIQAVTDEPVNLFADPVTAWRQAAETARSGDQVVVFGSFHTVGAVLEQL